MTSRREYRRVPAPIAADYTVPGGTVCIQVRCPDSDQHVALLQGLMAKLTDTDFWQGDDVDRPIMAGLWQEAYVETDWSNCVTPQETGAQDNIYLAQQMAQILNGNAFSFVVTNQMGGYAVQNPAANGDSWVHGGIRLRLGQYRLIMFCAKSNQGGLVTLNLNRIGGGTDIAVGSIDTFNAATVFNQRQTLDFDVDDPGEFELIGTISDGGGAGSTFQAFITGIQIWRLGDL